MSSFTLPVFRQELTVIKRPGLINKDQPVIKFLCRLEPGGGLVDLCWRRSTRLLFPDVLNKVEQGSVIFVTGLFAATICRVSGVCLVLKSIDIESVTERAHRKFKDGCDVPLKDDREEKLLARNIKYLEKKIELDRLMKKLGAMSVSESAKDNGRDKTSRTRRNP